jgi:hypothetical protein
MIPLTRPELMLLNAAEASRLRAEVEAAVGTDTALLIASLRAVAENMSRVANEIETRIGVRRDT